MDDASGAYQQSEVDRLYAEKLAAVRAAAPPRIAPPPEGNNNEMATPPVEGPKAATSDKPKEEGGIMHAVGTFIKELPEQALGGVFDALNNTVDGARDLGKAIGIPNYALQITNEKGEFDPTFLSPEEVEAKGGLHEGIVPKVPDAKTAAGGFTRAITNFAAGFIPVSKGLKAAGVAGGVARGMAAGAVADAVVMDPHQARLSTLLAEVPVLGQIIPEYMADNDPAHEGEWEGRIKNVLEGVVVGGAAEVAVGAATKLFKAYKIHANAPKAPKDAAATIADDIAAGEAKAAAFDEISPNAKGIEKDFGASPEFKSAARPGVDADPNAFKAPGELPKGATPSAKGPDPEALLHKGPDGKTYFNYAKMNTADDVKKVMGNLLDDAPTDGVMSLKEMKANAQAEYKSVSDLLGHELNRPFTPEQAVAARELLTASGENITKLAKIAADPMASPEDMFRFRKAVEVHGAMQEVVVAGRRATARSLKSWDIRVGSNAARAKQVNMLLEQGGKANKDLARMLAETGEAGGNVSGQIAKTLGGKFRDCHYQMWINGLLSSPSTHAVNVASNLGTSMMAIPERYIAAGYDALRGAGGSSLIEANARAVGFFNGLSDGFKLMTGKTKNELLTASSKFERPVDAISAAAWGKSPDSVVGKGLDYLGKVVGMPGWALEKGDNFFKGLNYRMQLQESATKTALEEGLTGKAFKERVADLVTNPTEAMQDVSADFARYQTFTNEAGPFAKQVSRLAATAPGGRYIMPFVKTPANILSYGFERTPLALRTNKYKEAIRAGGARASEARARAAAGSLLMASMVPLAMNGKVTGSGPSNLDEKRLLEQTGWKPYSIKVGDKYISYDRLEPISSLIGYTADITSIMGQLDEADGGELVAAGIAAFFSNLASKSYISGLVDFVSVMSSGSAPQISSYLTRFGAGMAQPFYSSAIKKGNNYFDPIARDYKADSVNGQIKSMFLRAQENVPGMGTDSPALVDVWGDEVRYDHGVAPALESISPIKIYKEDKDPVNKMIADNKIVVSMPSRSIMGVDLTNKEYHEYSKLAGKYAREMADDCWNSGVFDNATAGPEGEKALIVKQIFSKARTAAQKELIYNNPDVEDRIMNAKWDKSAKLRGE